MGRIGAAPRRVIAVAFVGAAAILGLRLTVWEPIIVTSDSMEPSVPRGSMVLLIKTAPSGEAGSLVAFDNPVDGALTVKRVVAVEGQTVALRDAELYIDGIRSVEPFVDLESIDGTYFGPVTVPKDHVFVLGDNRATSIDSRDFGPIAVDRLTTSVVKFPSIGAP